MYKNIIKRFLDIILALVLLPFFCVLFIIIAPLIYWEDNGPVFYNSKRIGQNGRLFKMYKFRSMKVNAPDLRLEDGSTFNSNNDLRVTKVGKFMRETSIDEIPQIFNVLIGDMSFIGPRPDPPDWMEKYSDEVKIFLQVKPGISGYSQAYFRNSIDGQEKIKKDVYYAQNISFVLDLRIFFRTIWVVLRRTNIYQSSETLQSKDEEDL